MTDPALPPIVRTVSVRWAPDEAFRRFTAGFGEWWPHSSHSVGGAHVKAVVFETRVGGRIYEDHHDGKRFEWGVVQEWEPPRRVVFSWHPGRPERTAQTVELLFTAEGSGTKLRLTSSDWHRWGDGAARAHRGYDLGWRWVLSYWAGQRTTPFMLALGGLMKVMQFAQRFRGGQAAIIARTEREIAAG